jgi:hypothetical protein
MLLEVLYVAHAAIKTQVNKEMRSTSVMAEHGDEKL